MAKKDVDVRFNLIDNFTASFNKTIGTLTAGTKKAQNAWKSVEKFGNGISSLGTKATGSGDNAACRSGSSFCNGIWKRR